jgi:amino acid adenylation domain-containing protein
MFEKHVLYSFFETVKHFGENNAFCIADRFYSYNDFVKHISKIRKAIQLTHVKRENIGLVTNDDIETYASIFAIWSEGFAYVPLHPNQPIERNLEIISQAEIDLIISSSSNNLFPDVHIIESTRLEFDEYFLQPKSTSDIALAYILFTSGSTGKPKGVQITRKNLGVFMKAFWETGIQINENDRCLQCFDLTFDVSVQSFLVPLTKGACVYTIPHDQIKYSYVYGLLDDHNLTFSVMAPSMLRYLQPYFNELDVPSLRYCIFTAESSPVNLLKEWSNCVPNAEIYDFYGPTEATIYCTYHKFKKEGTNKQLNGMLSIGKTMHGLNSIIIDEERNILKEYQKGELCISGDQLTPGYWKNPEKNKESFFEIDVNGILTRFYRTGDSCYFDDDRDILLIGRLDNQVKIQGYRIELGEIEYHSREFLHDQIVIAIAFENKTGNTEIALFIENPSIDTNAFLAYLKSKMPYYMIPTKILINQKIPLNANGKIDHKTLRKYITQ